MKTFRELMSEVAQPKAKDEIDFKAKHEIEMIDHPESEEHQHTSEKKGRKRLADYAKGQDMSVYESVKFGGKTFTDYKTFNSDREANRFLEKNDDYGVIGTKGGKVYVANMDDMGESYNLEESFSVFKPMSPAPGRLVSNRVQVKAFKTSDAMNTFLAKGDNALHWKPTDKSGLKSGTYKMDKRRGSDGKTALDFIREGTDDVEENAFVAKAAAAKKAGKDKFKLGDKKFPVTIKKDTADKIVEAKASRDFRMFAMAAERVGKDLVQLANDINRLDGITKQDVTKAFDEIKTKFNKLGVDSRRLSESVDLAENFKQGSLTLKDGSKVIVSKQNADLLNQMFKDLNAANRREMMKVAMEDKAGFEEILGFAREAL